MTPEKKLTRSEWSKTPYAGTDAKDTERDITRLLEKYNVKEIMVVRFTGEHGRPGFGVRFVMKGKCYRIALETLATQPQVSADELFAQVKRCVYYFLKSSLEIANVFMPAEQVLFAFLEAPGTGATMFEAAKPYLQQLTSPDFARLMLPPKQDEGGAS